MIKDFFVQGVKHDCRFCGTNIKHLVERTLQDGTKVSTLEANGIFAQATMALENGSSFTFNGCIDCLRAVKVEDFAAICKNDANMVRYDIKPLNQKLKILDIAGIYNDRLVTRL